MKRQEKRKTIRDEQQGLDLSRSFNLDGCINNIYGESLIVKKSIEKSIGKEKKVEDGYIVTL